MASLRGLVLQRGAVIVLVGAVALAVVGLVVTRSLVDRLGSNSPCAVVTKPSFSKNRSPAQITAGSRVTAHFEYVVADCEIDVYDIDWGNRLVQRINLPQIDPSDPRYRGQPAQTGMLYISFGNQGPPGGSLLAYDLRREPSCLAARLSRRNRQHGDAATEREIYMPAGESSGDGTWRIIDARTGLPTGAGCQRRRSAHNTIMGADGEHVYLAGVGLPVLAVASTTSNDVSARDRAAQRTGVRPVYDQRVRDTRVSLTARSFLGFPGAVASKAGRCCTRFRCRDSPFDRATFKRTPDHGISLSPDERGLYLLRHPEWLRACL